MPPVPWSGWTRTVSPAQLTRHDPDFYTLTTPVARFA